MNRVLGPFFRCSGTDTLVERVWNFNVVGESL